MEKYLVRCLLKNKRYYNKPIVISFNNLLKNIFSIKNVLNENCRIILDKFWDKTGSELSIRSRQKGSPWDNYVAKLSYW